MSRQNISATIDSDLLRELDQIASEAERNRSWLIGKAIQLYIEEWKDLLSAKARLHDDRLSPAELRKALGV